MVLVEVAQFKGEVPPFHKETDNNLSIYINPWLRALNDTDTHSDIHTQLIILYT